MNYGFLIRNDRCIGCHACTTACKSENEVPLGVDRTWVKTVERGVFPDTRRSFQVTRCNHCANPPCVAICPVEAMYQRPDGIVEFDADRCIGCKACLQACPYDAIYIDPSSGTAAKCHFCAHRVEMALEPACVVVCPEHAIIAGDVDDPDSEIARMLAERQVTVRKPEQGTAPKLFYVDGDEAALSPTVTERAPASFAWADVLPVGASGADPQPGPIHFGDGRFSEEIVRSVYNAQHRIPWHWQVPAYLVTKGMGAGVFMLLALGVVGGLFPVGRTPAVLGGLLTLLLIGVTTALLVLDLERPERFLRILTRPQWRSWLTRGGYLLVAFSTLVGAWWVVEAGAWAGFWEFERAVYRVLAFALGTPLAVGVAVYTAFLFGQAEGRDLWQSPLLPAHLFVQSIVAGAATMLPFATVWGPEAMGLVRTAFVAGLLLDLLMYAGELGVRHASADASRAARAIVKGAYRMHFWWGAVLLGHVVPLTLMALAPAMAGPAGVAALLGLYAYEHAFVMAPQEIPNS